jgi:hypothetical protein
VQQLKNYAKIICIPGNYVDTHVFKNTFDGIFNFSDIDECSSSPCKNTGTCVDKINGYTCTCLAGYFGTHCETGNITLLSI